MGGNMVEMGNKGQAWKVCVPVLYLADSVYGASNFIWVSFEKENGNIHLVIGHVTAREVS